MKDSDLGSWESFKAQLEGHYVQLEALHRELGGDYGETSGSLINVLQAALEASLEATRAECDRVRRECEDMLADMAFMRTAMGDLPRGAPPLSQHAEDPFARAGATHASAAVVASPTAGKMRIKAPLLDSRQVLKIEHDAVKAAFTERARKVTALYKELAQYAAYLPQQVVKLEIPPVLENVEGHPPRDVSLAQVGRLDAALRRCREELARRRAIVQSLAAEIVSLWAELAVDSTQLDTDLDRRILLDGKTKPETLGLTDEAIDALGDKKAALELQREERRLVIDRHLEAIRSMHAKLKLPAAELENFMLVVKGVSDHVMQACAREEDRLRELKRQHIGEFIAATRAELEALWDRLLYGDAQREAFAPAFDDDACTEASLQAHEDEVARLEGLLVELAPVLALVQKHMELEEERKQFAAITSDSSRFGQRGYNPMAESKMRTRIEKTMPRVEQSLKEQLQAYEDEHGAPFLVWGERYPPDAEVADASAAEPAAKVATGSIAKSKPAKSAAPTMQTRSTQRPRTPVDGLGRPAAGLSTPQQGSRSISTPLAGTGTGTGTAGAYGRGRAGSTNRRDNTASAASSPTKRAVSDTAARGRQAGVQSVRSTPSASAATKGGSSVLQERGHARLNSHDRAAGGQGSALKRPGSAQSQRFGTVANSGVGVGKTASTHSRSTSTSSTRLARPPSRNTSPTNLYSSTSTTSGPAAGARLRSASQSSRAASPPRGFGGGTSVLSRSVGPGSGALNGRAIATASAATSAMPRGTQAGTPNQAAASRLKAPAFTAGAARPATGLQNRLQAQGSANGVIHPATAVQATETTGGAGASRLRTMQTENWDAYRTSSAESEEEHRLFDAQRAKQVLERCKLDPPPSQQASQSQSQPLPQAQGPQSAGVAKANGYTTTSNGFDFGLRALANDAQSKAGANGTSSHNSNATQARDAELLAASTSSRRGDGPMADHLQLVTEEDVDASFASSWGGEGF